MVADYLSRSISPDQKDSDQKELDIERSLAENYHKGELIAMTQEAG